MIWGTVKVQPIPHRAPIGAQDETIGYCYAGLTLPFQCSMVQEPPPTRHIPYPTSVGRHILSIAHNLRFEQTEV